MRNLKSKSIRSTVTRMVVVTPEDAADYLSRTNFKSIIEYLTAESILHRSEDPVSFCRQLLTSKLANRSTQPFSPSHPTEYVRQTYESASANADENGRITTQPDLDVEVSSDVEGLTNRLALLETLIEACRTIATKLDPVEATQTIISQTLKILHAERATIYTLDSNTNELVLAVAEGARNIRIAVGTGIAGNVAATGVICKIDDCYIDSRFDSTNDRQNNFVTKTVLACPIKDQDDNIVGVIQVINKKDGVFTDLDQELLTILSTQAAIALKNAEIYHSMERSREKFRSLVDIIFAMQSDMGTNSLIFTMTQRAPKVVEADRCTIFLVDDKNEELWAMQGEVNIRIPLSAGIAGEVATTGQTINIPEAYEDSRFNQQVDLKSGYKTRSILCIAIKAGNEVVGVIQLLNKKTGPFNTEDETIMGSFLSVAGILLKQSNLFSKKKEESGEYHGASAKKTASSKEPQLASFGEEGDEEHDHEE